MWILIITLMGFNSQSGKAIAVVPMYSEEACRRAAATYENSVKSIAMPAAGPIFTTCLRTTP